jgi:hypothetical protein
LLATQLDASRVLGLISFDCHPGWPFFLTSETHIVITRQCLLLLTPLLSLRRRPFLFQQQNSLSLSSEGHSLDLCAHVHVGLPRSLPPAARAPRIALNFSPHKSGVAARRPAACATEKWASRRRLRCPPRCRRGRDATSDPPPRGRARLVESPHLGGN